MYLEIDEGYFEHPKTLDLCSRLQDSKACVYPLRLWKWACRSAKSGKLGKISAFAIEKAMDYDPKDGKCFDAMCLAGFIDAMPDGTFEIHDWMSYTGGAIARMDAKVKANKDRREAARAARDAGTMPELCRHDSGQTRQDKTSPDKTSENSPRARSNPPANDPEKPSAWNVASMFLRIRAEVIGGARGVASPFAQPQTGEVEKAERWISGMPAEETADLEPVFRLACKHVVDGTAGWTHEAMTKTGFLFAAIVTNWRDLREELHGCAPKVAARSNDGKPKPIASRVREM